MNIITQALFAVIGAEFLKLGQLLQITEKSVEMHGITMEISQRKGIPITEALELFNICMISSDMVIAHNLAFDRQMILVECIRNRRAGPFKFKTPEQFFCTMKSTTDLCKIEAISKRNGEKYFKFPTLTELHQHLFAQTPQNTHNSLVDILICLRCFVLLVKDEDIREKNRTFRSLYRNICP